MSNLVERARILLQQNRYEDAERELKHELTQNPNNAEALALLSICYVETSRHSDALEVIKIAIQSEPDNWYHFYVLARIYFEQKKLKNALSAINQAIELNPLSHECFLFLAYIQYSEEKWTEALESVNIALSFAPEDVQCLNLRTTILLRLKQKENALDTIDFALYNDPENSYSHANKGWALLEIGEYAGALMHFREALRLDPMNNFARSGLKEALKAKFPPYRMVLKYYLWLQTIGRTGKFVFVFGIYLIYRFMLELTEVNSMVKYIVYPLIFLYVIFAFSSWFIIPFSNMLLLSHKIGRYALTKDEKYGALIVTCLLTISLTALSIGYITQNEGMQVIGIGSGLMLIPVGATFLSAPETNKRKVLAIVSVVLACMAICSIVFVLPKLALLYVVGIAAFALISNIVSFRG